MFDRYWLPAAKLSLGENNFIKTLISKWKKPMKLFLILPLFIERHANGHTAKRVGLVNFSKIQKSNFDVLEKVKNWFFELVGHLSHTFRENLRRFFALTFFNRHLSKIVSTVTKHLCAFASQTNIVENSIRTPTSKLFKRFLLKIV